MASIKKRKKFRPTIGRPDGEMRVDVGYLKGPMPILPTNPGISGQHRASMCPVRPHVIRKG